MPHKKGKKRTVTTRNTQAEEFSIYQGPLPHYEDLQKYDEIIPNGADRLMKLVEQERSDRNKHISREYDIKEKEVKGNITNERFLLVIALVIVFLFLGLCAYGFYLGFATQSATILTVSLVGIIGYLMKQKTT